VLSFLDLISRDAASIPGFGKNEQKNLQERLFDEFSHPKLLRTRGNTAVRST
jgi:hypothetical protein